MSDMAAFEREYPDAILLFRQTNNLKDTLSENYNEHYYMSTDENIYYRVTEVFGRKYFVLKCDSQFVINDIKYLIKQPGSYEVGKILKE